MKNSQLDIFQFDDFRILLRERFLEIKKLDPTVSYRTVSQKSGLKSQSHFHQILNKKKAVLPTTLTLIAEALGFQGEGKTYLLHLAGLQQSPIVAEREYHAKAILALRGFRKRFPLTAAHQNFYKIWYYSVIYEMIPMRTFKNQSSWINSRLGTDLTQNDLIKVWTDLEQLGLIKINTYGRIIRLQDQIDSGETVSSHLVLEFHRAMLKRASESLATVREDAREILALTFGLSKRRYPEFQSKIQAFYHEMFELASHEKDVDEVYQINLQLFPLTQGSDE